MRPRFESSAFKSWLDVQRGLSFGAKALLDAEAARAILEHFLDKDPETDVLNRERAERVAPSRQACMAYLKWKKRPMLNARRPEEPAGPGREAWEWDDLHPETQDIDPEEYMRRASDYTQQMEALGRFGDRVHEFEERRKRQALEKEMDERREAMQDFGSVREQFRSAFGT